jgi:hypothetical protein
MFTFPASVPALTGHNPTREGWTIAGAVATIANAGPSGLAGLIIAHGYDPSRPIRSCENIGCHSMATMASAILAGLDSRKTDKGETKPLVLATDEEGKGIAIPVDAIRKLLSEAEPENYVPATMIPAHGGGNNRTAAYVLACLYVAALRRDPADIGPMASVDVGADGDLAAGLSDNMLDSFRLALTPWQKVQASLAILRETPSLAFGKNAESRFIAKVGCKRGDGQTMHAGAVAILKHSLAVDMDKRALSAAEWREVRDLPTATEAAALVIKYQTETRAKAVGSPVWAEALGKLPESAVINPRTLAEAMAKGTEEAFNSFIQDILAKYK